MGWLILKLSAKRGFHGTPSRSATGKQVRVFCRRWFTEHSWLHIVCHGKSILFLLSCRCLWTLAYVQHKGW